MKIQVYKYPAKLSWEAITSRPVMDTVSLEKVVKKILKKVQSQGDKALYTYTKKLDGVSVKKIGVSQKEISSAGDFLSPALKSAIGVAKRNIETFHRSQEETINKIGIMPGVTCWRKPVPISRIGLYIPGGSAPLFSTILMLAVPARLAGCNEIVLCTPPSPSGDIHPAVLYTAALCGITKIYKVGGAQAIAAMAYGTKAIPKVFKIFGPGNQYVTAAKKQVQVENVAIDFPAGPSELLVIGDDTADPLFVAADLLSQAEHGKDSQVILLTTSPLLAEKVVEQLSIQVKSINRKKIAKSALLNSKVIILESIDEAIELSNLYAPEHLIIACENPELVSEKITAAGSVFIGNYSPESAGDYATGTNHTLPTNGYAAMYSGVSLESFVKKITYQQLTQVGLEAIGDTVMEMAEAEGLGGHKNAIAIRLNK